MAEPSLDFDDIAQLALDPERLFQQVAQSLVAAGELHRLFDLRLIQERRRLGLTLLQAGPYLQQMEQVEWKGCLLERQERVEE